MKLFKKPFLNKSNCSKLFLILIAENTNLLAIKTHFFIVDDDNVSFNKIIHVGFTKFLRINV